MTRRLLLSYLGVAFAILLALEIPLAILAARHERDLAASQAQREATGLAVVAADALERNQVAELRAVTAQYRARTGGDVLVYGPDARLVAGSSPGATSGAGAGTDRRFLTVALSGRPVTTIGEVGGVVTAVAVVPISGAGRPGGALVLRLAADAVDDRTHAIWLAEALFAAGALFVTGVVSLWLARGLAEPLKRLESTVRALGAGDLTARAAPDGPPKVRALGEQFNRMADRLEELVGAQARFVADASHQLRSPLTALRLRLENLEAELPAPPADDLAAAGREVQRLSRLVDGLLTLSRADASAPDPGPVDVAAVIAERCEAWSALAEERRIGLTHDTPAAGAGRLLAAVVAGDLEQILDNLVANAVEAAGDGGLVAVRTVMVGRGVTGRSTMEIHVMDDGPGMAEDDRQRAFDRFWRGSASGPGGSGLGLAVVAQLAARSGLTVELLPAPGGGLDAVIRLGVSVERQARAAATH